MKTVKYDSMMKIVCPVCKKVLLEDKNESDSLHDCKHLKLWYNEADGSILTAKAPFKSSLYGDRDEFHKVAKKHKLIVHKYDGGYLGGCVNAIDLIAFQK